jgi:hypothetical protein
MHALPRGRPAYDHTYVTSSHGHVWTCLGGSNGGRLLNSGSGDAAIADCVSIRDLAEYHLCTPDWLAVFEGCAIRWQTELRGRLASTSLAPTFTILGAYVCMVFTG